MKEQRFHLYYRLRKEEVPMAKKILIIDDETDLLMMATARLKKAGYEVVTAPDGQAGLNVLELEKPDLVLLDLSMPVMDGYQVCRHMKSCETTKNIPIVLFTASSATMPLDQKTKEIGAQDYVPKPFDNETLIGKIKNILGE